MIFLITGCDCSGKSSCFVKLKDFFKNYYVFEKKYKKELKYKIKAGKDLYKLYLENKDVIGERVPYLEDLVYSKILEGKNSFFEKKIDKYLNELCNYQIIYFTAETEELKRRLKNRGDEFINEDELDGIKKEYDNYLKMISKKNKNNIHIIDTTNLSEGETFEKTKNLILKINKLHIATITLTPSLPLISSQPYHMCLAHLIKKDNEYRKFYKEMIKSGKFVIMDNGEYEGERLSKEELVKLYNEVRPSEIILSDSIKNYNESFNLTIQSFTYLTKHLLYKPQFMIVPHGNNIDEVIRFLEKLLDEIGEKINTVGLGKLLISGESREEEVRRTCEVLNKKKLNHIRIHLLGFNEKVSDIRKIHEKYNKVRGLDTSFATIMTYEGKEISSDSSREEVGEMDWSKDKIDEELLLKNIKLFNSYIN